MNEMTWKIENNWMNIAFFHPSQNTPEDPKADERFAMEIFKAIQHIPVAQHIERRTPKAQVVSETLTGDTTTANAKSSST